MTWRDRSFPIRVTYYDEKTKAWRLWSRHRSQKQAERSYQNLARTYPDMEIQMRAGTASIIRAVRAATEVTVDNFVIKLKGRA